MARRVKDFIEISEYTSLDKLIDYLKTIRDSLPDDADAELRLKGDDFFGRRLTISYSRELTPREEERETRYHGAATAPGGYEDWMDDIRKKLNHVPKGGKPMPSKYETFTALHVPGDPVVLYNIWDTGSARAVEAAGAKALATGSHPVGDASGFGDGQKVPLDFVFANAGRIMAAIDLPLTVDFEGAYSDDPGQAAANVAALAATGAIGCNFEDQVIGGEGVHPLKAQAKRIEAIRKAAGDSFFLNARTDLFIKSPTHDSALLDEVIERGKAFADAGASGFFVPRLADARQAERVVKEVPLPLNLIAFPGAPTKRDWANAGVARISHGPFPHRELMAKLTEMATAAIG